MATLPYVTATGNIERALRGIQEAATPTRVSQDFVKTILGIRGGSGAQMTSFLKKIGFSNTDGTPTEIYIKFRNPSTSGRAAAAALKYGYGPLFIRNEYMYRLPDEKLRGLIIEETGQSSDSSVVAMALASIKAIKKFADWSGSSAEDKEETIESPQVPSTHVEHQASSTVKRSGVGLNLSYTINLNLPATSDVSVFNAIFKSLKENLLKDSDE